MTEQARQVLSYTTHSPTSRVSESATVDGWDFEIRPKLLRSEILEALAWVSPVLFGWWGMVAYFVYKQAELSASLKVTAPALPTRYVLGFIAASVVYVGFPILLAVALHHSTSLRVNSSDLIFTRYWRWKSQIRRQSRTAVKSVRHGLNGVTVEFQTKRPWLFGSRWTINLPRNDRVWLASRLSEALGK